MGLLLSCKIALFVGAMALSIADFETMEEDKKREAAGKTISISGFCYEVEGSYYLAKEPKLKSCCVKKAPFLLQVYPKEAIASSHSLQRFSGILSYDQENRSWSILKAELVPERRAGLLFLLVVPLVWILWRRIK